MTALKIGLTGGIASGKSAAAAEFQRLGVPIRDADQISRDLVEPGQPALQAIADHFGPTVLRADGRLDRTALKATIFKTPRERRWLEALLHPAVRRQMSDWASADPAPYLILVVPLLLEAGFTDLVDRVLIVDLPPPLQRQRLLARDGTHPDQIARILSAQTSRAARLARADDLIDNQGDLDDLHAQVRDWHERYSRITGA